MKTNEEIYTSLDIGTKNITLINSIKQNGKIEIIGYAKEKANGFKDGVLKDKSVASTLLRDMIEKVELMSSRTISSINVGISGKHISSFNNSATVDIKSGEVTSKDIIKINDAVKLFNGNIIEKKIIHIIPQNYIIDNGRSVKDPIYAPARSNLQINAVIVVGDKKIIYDIEELLLSLSLKVEYINSSAFAGSVSVLSEDDKKNNIIFADVGGNTTSILIYYDNTLKDFFVIPKGGNEFAKYIAKLLDISEEQAEQKILDYGDCFLENENKGTSILIEGTDKENKLLPEHIFIKEIREIAQKFFKTLKNTIDNRGTHNFNFLSIILCGGTLKLKNITKVISSIFPYNVRIGIAQNVTGIKDVIKDVSYISSIGLIFLSIENKKKEEIYGKKDIKKSIVNRFKRWFEEII